MKKTTKNWLKFAKDDLYVAEVLFRNKSYRNCIAHCHQAIEKILKAIIIEKGKSIRKTHDLIGLLADTKVDFPDDILKTIEELNPHYLPVRYPDILTIKPIIYKRKKTQNFLKKSKEIFKWLQVQLDHLK